MKPIFINLLNNRPIIILFGLPPFNKRPNSVGFIRNFLFVRYDPRCDVAYLHYKVFVLHFIAISVLLLPYVVSFFLRQDINLPLFSVIYNADSPVDELVYGFPQKIFPILASITILYSATLTILHTGLPSRSCSSELEVKTIPEPEVRSLGHLFVFLFLIGTGLTLWSGPWWMREYLFFIHDFNEHSSTNFLIFATFYFSLYQTFYCGMLALTTVRFTQSALKNFINPHFKQENLKENNDDNK